MTTTIIGVGNLGSTLARRLVRGGERVVLGARDSSHAAAVAKELGTLASDASVSKAISEVRLWCSRSGSTAWRQSSPIVAGLLPPEAHYVKAFGTLGASSLAAGANRSPRRAVLFYATDDAQAADTVERLISVAGFDPVKAGGLKDVARLEGPDGDLSQGGLKGALLDADEARAVVNSDRGLLI